LIVSPSLIGSLAACQPINENQTLQTCAHIILPDVFLLHSTGSKSYPTVVA
jgi:hypothetical protein